MALEAAAPSEEVGRVKATRIVSSHVSVPERIIEIWRSRQLLLNLVRTEIRIKYKNSVLGLLWSLLSPAMGLLVYTLVFSVALKNGIPEFVILLFSGLLVWNLFQTSVLSATGVIVNNAGLVKKVSFPREILALASVGSASVFFFFQACVMVLFLVVLHWRPAFGELWLLIVALVPLLVFVAAVSIFLAAVNVYLRDTQHLIEVVVGSAWFWACPIVYSYQHTVYAKLSAHGLVWLYFLNPITPIVMTFQRVIYARTGLVALTLPKVVVNGHQMAQTAQLLPSWGNMTYVEMDLVVLGVSLVLLYLAMVVFGRLAGNFAEEL
jgi:ABC-2 type transport system permease protein